VKPIVLRLAREIHETGEQKMRARKFYGKLNADFIKAVYGGSYAG